MDLNSDHFALFGLPTDYAVDLALLGERYRDLQRDFHPDRAANKSEREQRLAVQYAGMINAAYEALKSPLFRARYLLQLSGRQDQSQTTTIGDHDFLFQQIDLRERMADIGTAPDPHHAYSELESEVEAKLLAEQNLFAQQYAAGDLDQAEQSADKMQFFSNLLNQLQAIEDTLDD